jgi:hypothetical protein
MDRKFSLADRGVLTRLEVAKMGREGSCLIRRSRSSIETSLAVVDFDPILESKC